MLCNTAVILVLEVTKFYFFIRILSEMSIDLNNVLMDNRKATADQARSA